MSRFVGGLALVVLLLAAADSSMARGPWRASEKNTQGWHLMTAEERIAHQTRIRSFTTLEACLAYQSEHHRLMAERARQQGTTLPDDKRDICAHLRGKNDR